MRNISFMLTIDGFKSRRKDVTRRLGWWHLKPGEPLVRLGVIEIVSAKPERLDAIATRPEAESKDELRREDFPRLSAEEFIAMFCKSHSNCRPGDTINRIEFRYIDATEGPK